MLRGGAASLCATLRGGAALLGAALSQGRRGTLPLASHDRGIEPSSVSCHSARVLSLHARWVVVVVVMGVAVGAVAVVMGVVVGAVAGVARSAAWGSRGSSCGVESSLAPLAES